jgi:hypothetical protein
MIGNIYEVSDLEKVVEAAVRSTPDAKNPIEEYTCLNTDRYDPSKHCIAAQALVDIGFEEALNFADNNDTVRVVINEANIRDRFTHEAVDWLATLQDFFDTKSHMGYTWSLCWNEFPAWLRDLELRK